MINFETQNQTFNLCVDSQLECFKFNNPKLYQVSLSFLDKLRSAFSSFPNLNFQVERDMFKFASLNGEKRVVELCISMNLFNLPVFFRINQNSLVLVVTSIQMCNFKPNTSWINYEGCYLQKTFLEDPDLGQVFSELIILMEGFSRNLMKEIAQKQQDVLQKKQEVLNRSNNDLVWQAPLIASICSLLMSEEISLDSLTNNEFLIRLLLNTGLTASMLVGIEWLLDKIKNEFKS